MKRYGSDTGMHEKEFGMYVLNADHERAVAELQTALTAAYEHTAREQAMFASIVAERARLVERCALLVDTLSAACNERDQLAEKVRKLNAHLSTVPAPPMPWDPKPALGPMHYRLDLGSRVKAHTALMADDCYVIVLRVTTGAPFMPGETFKQVR